MSRGVTLKSKAISEKVFMLKVPVDIPFTGSASRQPRTPPTSARSSDSSINENRMLRLLKPSTRRVAISRVRYAVAAYIVFITAKDEPTAMIAAMRYPRTLIGNALPVWASKYSLCRNTSSRILRSFASLSRTATSEASSAHRTSREL